MIEAYSELHQSSKTVQGGKFCKNIYRVILNNGIGSSTFPEILKSTEVTLDFKTGDLPSKTN